MNVFVVIGGLTDWSNEGGAEFATEVVGVYADRAKAELIGVRYLADNRQARADECEVELDDIADDEFWFEIVVKQLDDV